MTLRFAVSAVLGLALVFPLGGCETDPDLGVGDPCVPEEESRPDGPGASINEVTVETGSAQCESRVCLSNHFQGRVSCPLGQSGSGEPGCFVPGTTTPISASVLAWDLDRPPSRAVYCSCRCDGPDPNAEYCACPSGFECRKLIEDLGTSPLPGEVGSYCIKAGTAFDPSEAGGPTCADDPTHAACQ